jgi:hypothetical protein
MKVLFGENFILEVKEFSKSTHDGSYTVHTKLIINNPDILIENYKGIDTTIEDDVCYYITNCCKFMGITKRVNVITSVDVN